MEFPEFVKILEEFYKGGKSQAKFTKDLFCQIANDEQNSEIKHRSDQTFIQYYKGIRPIRQIAKIIQYELDKTKFKNYLAQREFNDSAKEKMCQAFEKAASDIDTKNLFEKITGIFVNIINDACNKLDGRCKKQPVDDEVILAIDTVESDEKCNEQSIEEVIPVIDTVEPNEKCNEQSVEEVIPVIDIVESDEICNKQAVDDEVVPEIDDVESDENHESLFSNLNITKEDISELKTLAKDMSNKIYVLLDIGNKINSKANEMGFNIPAIVNPGLYNALDKNYEAFHDFTYDLRRYNSKYPNRLFDRAIEIFLLLKANSFIEYYSPFYDRCSLISELQDIFIKILDELKSCKP